MDDIRALEIAIATVTSRALAQTEPDREKVLLEAVDRLEKIKAGREQIDHSGKKND